MITVKTKYGDMGLELDREALCRVELKPPVRKLTSPKTPVEKRMAKAFADCVAGRTRRFPFTLHLAPTSTFSRKVLTACLTIPPGEVVTYGELARMAGKPKAARAAGRVMARNPISIVIPCHRVVASDLSLHGYGGGLAMKKALLESEGVTVVKAKGGWRVLKA
jgi:methylated-DNA-[protein]-cysteine S-methyltransferase